MRKVKAQPGQVSRWKLRSRMAARRSGRRAALTLCTRSNRTFAAQRGQLTSVFSNTDMVIPPRSDRKFGQPGPRRMLGFELAALERRVQLREPLARRAELV